MKLIESVFIALIFMSVGASFGLMLVYYVFPLLMFQFQGVILTLLR